jgi:hypothetical protein
VNTAQASETYFVHHAGEVHGPFEVSFIEAMVMAGVYARNVFVQELNSEAVMPLAGVLPGGAMPPPLPGGRRSTNNSSAAATAWICSILGSGLLMLIICLVIQSRWGKDSTKTSSPYSSSSSSSSSPYSSYPYTSTSTPPPVTLPAYTPPKLTLPPLPAGTYDRPSAPPLSVPEPVVDNTKVYRDASGRSYRVSSYDYGRLQGMKSQLDVKQRAIDISEANVRLLEIELDAARAALDNTSQYQIDSFNRKVDRFNALNEELKSEVSTYNQSVRAFNSELSRVGTLTSY